MIHFKIYIFVDFHQICREQYLRSILDHQYEAFYLLVLIFLFRSSVIRSRRCSKKFRCCSRKVLAECSGHSPFSIAGRRPSFFSSSCSCSILVSGWVSNKSGGEGVLLRYEANAKVEVVLLQLFQKLCCHFHFHLR